MPTAMTPAARRIFLAVAVIALGGVAVSSVSLYHHYGSSKTNYCDFGESFNCDIVNRSIYSTVFGVPDALIGIVGYTGLFVVAFFFRDRAGAARTLLLGAAAGLAFALYLTYIEALVLATWCILCLSSLTLIFLITLLAAVLVGRAARVG